MYDRCATACAQDSDCASMPGTVCGQLHACIPIDAGVPDAARDGTSSMDTTGDRTPTTDTPTDRMPPADVPDAPPPTDIVDTVTPVDAPDVRPPADVLADVRDSGPDVPATDVVDVVTVDVPDAE